MKARYSQGGRRLGMTARHKLISVDCVEWENISGVEVSNSYSSKLVASRVGAFISTCVWQKMWQPFMYVICLLYRISTADERDMYPHL